VRILSWQAHRETNIFFAASEVEIAQYHQDLFRFHRDAAYFKLKSELWNILAKATALRINLNTHCAPVAAHTHTHPSHSQSSRLLFTSLSVGIKMSGQEACGRHSPL
jgi:hypothetical protein